MYRPINDIAVFLPLILSRLVSEIFIHPPSCHTYRSVRHPLSMSKASVHFSVRILYVAIRTNRPYGRARVSCTLVLKSKMIRDTSSEERLLNLLESKINHHAPYRTRYLFSDLVVSLSMHGRPRALLVYRWWSSPCPSLAGMPLSSQNPFLIKRRVLESMSSSSKPASR